MILSKTRHFADDAKKTRTSKDPFPQACATIIKPILRTDTLTPTVFHNSWWLNAVSDRRYEEVDVRSGGRIVARFPFVMEKGPGRHRLCSMPELTHLLGPALAIEGGNFANRTLKHFELMESLIRQLGAFDSFHHTMHQHLPDTLAFGTAGFKTETSFTYEVYPRPVTVLWNQMRDKTRNVIRRARERYTVEQWRDPAAFAALYAANLRARGQKNVYTRIAAAAEAAINQEQGCILAARNEAGAVLGAVFLVWDHHAMYYLLSTRCAESDNVVMSLLVWHSITLASQAGLIFDFDGIGPPGNRLFYAGFGGQATPRLVVHKHSLRFRTTAAVSRAIDRLKDGALRRVQAPHATTWPQSPAH